jgi:molybdopterin-biosynthesis enzyme MoeA-like protein
MKTGLLIACAALALLLAPARGAASTAGECQASLKKLSKATEDLLFYGGGLGARSQSLMMSHVAKTKEFVEKADSKSALKQMDAFSTELSRATGARTIKMTDAIFLQEAANDAIVCLNGLTKAKP